VAFVIVLGGVLLFSFGLSRLSVRVKRDHRGLGPYACGEEIQTHMIQPDYEQFLPFAIFFTLLHVAALVLATVFLADLAAFVMAIIFLVGVMLGLIVLYRR
jgi:NADH-quinone oxidoreductase subunit A